MRIIDLSSPMDASGRNTDTVPLDWLFRPGVLLDLTGQPPGAVTAAYLEREIDRIDYRPRPLDIVLLNTGASRRAAVAARHRVDAVELDASASELLLDAGTRVVGTDAFRLDAPFDQLAERFQRNGEDGVPWSADFAGQGSAFCRIERLANLDELPAHGFTIACFPAYGARAGAGWARAVAIVGAAL
jgi:cyclase